MATARLTLSPAYGVTDFTIVNGVATITDALVSGGEAKDVRLPRFLTSLLLPIIEEGRDIVVDAIDDGKRWTAVAFI